MGATLVLGPGWRDISSSLEPGGIQGETGWDCLSLSRPGLWGAAGSEQGTER